MVELRLVLEAEVRQCWCGSHAPTVKLREYRRRFVRGVKENGYWFRPDPHLAPCGRICLNGAHGDAGLCEGPACPQCRRSRVTFRLGAAP